MIDTTLKLLEGYLKGQVPGDILADNLSEQGMDDKVCNSLRGTLNLYRISQGTNTEYDTYDMAIVVAKTEEEAKLIHPDMKTTLQYGAYEYEEDEYGNSPIRYALWKWVSNPNEVAVELVGKALPGMKPGVVCASFNAG